MRISDLQTKDVVNLTNGKKLGQVMDVEFDMENGRIESFTIPHAVKFFGWLGSGTEIVIHWRHIVKIGEDVILVRLDETGLQEPFEHEGVERPLKPFRSM